MLGLVGWMAIGIVAGALARVIVPGQRGGGWLAPLLLGVIGAVMGGWLGWLIFDVDAQRFWVVETWSLAIAGSLVFLIVWALVAYHRKEASSSA